MRTPRFAAVLATLTLAVLGSACSATTSSRNIRTAGLVALVDVTAKDDEHATVSTALVIGGASSNTYVVLEGGDRLYAESNGEKREMNATSDGEYEAKFNRAEGEYIVSLNRDVDAAAPKSSGTLPPPFQITSDFGDAPISRKNDDVTVTWTPGGSGSDVEIELEGDCIHSEHYNVGGDPGSFTIEKRKIEAWSSDKKKKCNVTVTVSHTTHGTVDPAFDSDSRFELRQVRKTRFVSGP
jgi:hypothetical protein